MTFSRVFLLSLLALCFAVSAFGLLLPDEVQTLREVAQTLGKTDWDFSVDPCSGESNWVKPLPLNGEENAVTCGNCSLVNGTNYCHVVSIILKQENLNGTLPQELVKFPYLYEIDLTRNYLSGTIPMEWGSIKLLNISLLGNRLTGPIPKELGNISTLKSLVLEYNQFSGNLPPELGNLTKIERLFLTSNNFTGDLPATFERLTALKDFRIGDNQFSGRIPNWIQDWTRLEKLVIQGSGLSGPIPSGISSLTNLIDLRITDLKNGADSTFPELTNMTRLQTLILRSCNIIGTLPEYLGNFRSLITIDLSFNKLSGTIPSTYYGLRKSQYLYLTGNLLTGPVPEWTDQAGFVVGNPGQQTCETGRVNLFSSSLTDNNSGIVPCVGSISCPKLWYSLHINCGGKQISENGNTYDDDSDAGGPARFRKSATNWAGSNTGHFVDNTRSPYYTWSKTSGLSMTNAELYMDARVSPISLTYYGYCLGNGSYTGKLVLKDFNIAQEAGGVGKAIIKNFTAAVTRNTLEIRFYWAGRGTIDLPFRSVYGPLILVWLCSLILTYFAGVLSFICKYDNFECLTVLVEGRNVTLPGEIVSGKRNTISLPTNECFYLLDWANELKEDNLLKLVDERLGSEFNKEEAMVMIRVALLCTNSSQKLRPSVSSVVRMLESRSVVQDLESEILDDKKLESMRLRNQESQCLSMDYSLSDFSTSVTDPHPHHLDSSYWEESN
ncbi:hypothetical protein L6164_018299 [Bauhinia variegata]|uniref:Uncharacterized protein n=1 Tax=Bauhinia variegata TaxID=167791 RepID=A0ACB9NAW6_BAUVA|nr:hypothetical protein L6164_018299 [Bauhinia variegata]